MRLVRVCLPLPAIPSCAASNAAIAARRSPSRHRLRAGTPETPHRRGRAAIDRPAPTNGGFTSARSRANMAIQEYNEGRRQMDRTVARMNIEHFRRLLAKETDKSRRQVVATPAGRGRGQARRAPRPRNASVRSVEASARIAILRSPSGLDPLPPRPGPSSNGCPCHCRQWVGCTSSRSRVSTFIQPPTMRRQGNTSACGPSTSRTANSRSQSKGAVAISRHMLNSLSSRTGPSIEIDHIRQR